MKKDDLPLLRFDFRPPPCRIVIFPIAARVGKARHVASKLDGMVGPTKQKARDGYWKERCKDLAAELEKRGLSEEQIAAAILDFRDAVEVEMRKAAAKANQSPRPAAWDDGPKSA
ncbi:hypothetical protein ACO34A_09925 [Rhizobium sp. ACO-34A]|nr:DUF6074 family protein [Rhizobium sp. ACO-34A]ATN34123.1 hypothetical protein ACO34A_09925 [Rhizobium sp. ACO-34A]